MDDHLNNLYDADFYRWVHRQAELLQARDFARLDLPNLIEEIESMGQSKRNALEHRMLVLLTHLLKYQMQPEHISGSWTGTIVEQRKRIHRLLKKTPSLRRTLDDCIAEAYADIANRLTTKAKLPRSCFPEKLACTKEQLLTQDFMPWTTASTNAAKPMP
ncbi:protein of unknown function DUF29 [Duganella sp. CF402]|uniref:DUF29 domain-containing protein n=1 Tax=unclassified Duganella TaxID=2636909 RepID=UPI0008B0F81D|nr:MULTISPECIES: DUF29 domain-containing protein [unclassified Duganella]RZT08947.1 uncharacterized protein DUF29 [Duganella sp. BK701]SEL75976.1 protein of unknown function DUF29 [Duganella sp. CF402]